MRAFCEMCGHSLSGGHRCQWCKPVTYPELVLQVRKMAAGRAWGVAVETVGNGSETMTKWRAWVAGHCTVTGPSPTAVLCSIEQQQGAPPTPEHVDELLA